MKPRHQLNTLAWLVLALTTCDSPTQPKASWPCNQPRSFVEQSLFEQPPHIYFSATWCDGVRWTWREREVGDSIYLSLERDAVPIEAWR